MGKNHWAAGALSMSLVGCGQIIHDPEADGPRATDLSITPSPARSGDTLRCRYLFEDPEGDPDMSTIRWLVGDVEVGSGGALTDGFAGGDEVTCEVTPADGHDAGEPTSITAPILHGAIAGTVFLDADENGERDEGEAGIAGRIIYLDDDGDGSIDDGEPRVVSDQRGDYEFPDLLAGTYRVAQVKGAFTQTFPRLGQVFTDEFAAAQVDVGRWSVSGNGVSQQSGVLTLDRDEPMDAAVYRQSLGGDGRVALTMRNTRSNWKDMFSGFQIAGGCDAERDVRGVAFGFSRYGNFFVGQLRCNGATWDYPMAYAIDQWYEIEAEFADGEIRILVDGIERATGQVPRTALGLSLPGPFVDGGDETNSISQVDRAILEIHEYSHEVEIADGEVAAGLDFGTAE